ncbi:hypothetical protein MHYP_G00251380 [Metynnis hypsauchen]
MWTSHFTAMVSSETTDPEREKPHLLLLRHTARSQTKHAETKISPPPSEHLRRQTVRNTACSPNPDQQLLLYIPAGRAALPSVRLGQTIKDARQSETLTYEDWKQLKAALTAL